jgi:hypothetical protein
MIQTFLLPNIRLTRAEAIAGLAKLLRDVDAMDFITDQHHVRTPIEANNPQSQETETRNPPRKQGTQ